MDLTKEGELIKFDSLHHEIFDVSVEFMQNYIYESDQKKVILQNLQNLYVFVIAYNEKWKDILDKDAYKILKKYKHYIIGFILVDNNTKTDKIQYIDYIDTRIKKYNIAYQIIEIYEKNNNICLIPYDILETAARYWKKYFERKYYISTLYDLEIFKNKLVMKHKVCWDFLFKLYDS